MRSRSENTQRGNPHELTVRQHVYPSKSIARFQRTKTVELFDLARNISRPARADDPIFCADRAWNHGAEHGFMKDIEDAFQRLVDPILAGTLSRFDDQHTEIINKFYGLWASRAHWRRLPYQTIKAGGPELRGAREDLSLDSQELLEKHNIIAVRPNGSFAMRDFVAPSILMNIDDMSEALVGRRWGVLFALEAEFLVPDVPSHGVIPIAPKMALALDNRSAVIRQDGVEKINRALCSGVREYLFARSLWACPGIPFLMPAMAPN